MASGTKSFDRDHVGEFDQFVADLIAPDDFDGEASLHQARGLFESWKEFGQPATVARRSNLDEAEEFGTGDDYVQQAEGGELVRTRWVFLTVEWDYDQHVLVAISADVRTPEGAEEVWLDIWRTQRDPVAVRAAWDAANTFEEPNDEDAQWQDAGAYEGAESEADGDAPDEPVQWQDSGAYEGDEAESEDPGILPESGAGSPDGTYAYAAADGDVWLFPQGDADRLAALHAADPDGFGQAVLSRGGELEFISGEDAVGFPWTGAGIVTLAGGQVADVRQVVSQQGRAQLDLAEVQRVNVAALEAIVAEGVGDAQRTTRLVAGNGHLLLGDGHGWAAVRAAAGADGAGSTEGTLTFRRNRMSANELVVHGVAAATVRDALRAVLDAADYPYRDKGRVVIK